MPITVLAEANMDQIIVIQLIFQFVPVRGGLVTYRVFMILQAGQGGKAPEN